MLSPTTANLLNALILLVMGFWGAFASNFGSPTVYIAPVFGLIFLILHNGLRVQNKIVSHIVPVLTLIQILMFSVPFIKREGSAKLRVGLILLAGIIALVSYIIFFINARKERNS